MSAYHHKNAALGLRYGLSYGINSEEWDPSKLIASADKNTILLSALLAEVAKLRALVEYASRDAAVADRSRHATHEKRVLDQYQSEMNRLEAIHGPCPKRVAEHMRWWMIRQNPLYGDAHFGYKPTYSDNGYLCEGRVSLDEQRIYHSKPYEAFGSYGRVSKRSKLYREYRTWIRRRVRK